MATWYVGKIALNTIKIGSGRGLSVKKKDKKNKKPSPQYTPKT